MSILKLPGVTDSISYLLTAYWILAAGAALIALLPLPGTSSFRAAVCLTACRGKLWDDRPHVKWLGVLTDASVPQSWFLHFYILGAVWNAALLFLACASLGREAPGTLQATRMLAVLLLQIHLSRRAIETAYLMKYPASARMHLVAYVFGLSYYFVLPLALVPATLWQHDCLAKLSLSLTPLNDGVISSVGTAFKNRSLYTLLAVSTFFAGNLLQYSAHRTFAVQSMKGGRSKAGYRIPKGGAFEWVSCPHYLGEIVLYLGLAILIGNQSLDIWLILAWVVFNLMLAAGPTHAWYKEQFKTYPVYRKALIPYIY